MNSSISDRLEVLEKRSRFLTGLVVIQAICLFYVISGWNIETPAHAEEKIQEADTIRAKLIELSAADGKLVLEPTGVSLFNKEGKLRASLSNFQDDPSLSLNDQSGKNRASLSILKDEPSLDFRDKAENARATLTIFNDEPSLDLKDKAGKIKASMGVKGQVLFDKP